MEARKLKNCFSSTEAPNDHKLSLAISIRGRRRVICDGKRGENFTADPTSHEICVRDKITRPMYISKRINPLLIWVSYILCAAVWLTILSITLGSIEPTATIAANTTLASAGPLCSVPFKSEPSNNKNNNNNGKSNGNNGSPAANRKEDFHGSSSLVSFCGWCLLLSATTVSLQIVAWWRHASAQSSTDFWIYSTPVIWKRDINLAPRVL